MFGTLYMQRYYCIVNSFMISKDYDEELKIDIANAMSNDELGIQGEDYEQWMESNCNF